MDGATRAFVMAAAATTSSTNRRPSGSRAATSRQPAGGGSSVASSRANARSNTARSRSSFVRNVKYTVWTATSAADATSAIVVALRPFSARSSAARSTIRARVAAARSWRDEGFETRAAMGKTY